MRTLDQANPKVLSLFDSLGIKLLSYDQVPKSAKGSFNAKWYAFYDCISDYVAFNPNPKSKIVDLDECLLHEIVHWSGHSKRLGRDAIVKSENGKMNSLSHIDIATEETTAQIGMYLLAIQLGFDKKQYRAKRDIYLLSWGNVNEIMANKDAKLAVNFINGLLERKAA